MWDKLTGTGAQIFALEIIAYLIIKQFNTTGDPWAYSLLLVIWLIGHLRYDRGMVVGVATIMAVLTPEERNELATKLTNAENSLND